jgi:AbrB family looped-hinge helix DNA binding protein
MNLSTVTQKGQITVPVDFRKILGLKPYDRVLFEKKNNKVLLSKAVDIMDLSGSLKPRKNKGMDPVKTREYMEKHYQRA